MNDRPSKPICVHSRSRKFPELKMQGCPLGISQSASRSCSCKVPERIKLLDKRGYAQYNDYTRISTCIYPKTVHGSVIEDAVQYMQSRYQDDRARIKDEKKRNKKAREASGDIFKDLLPDGEDV